MTELNEKIAQIVQQLPGQIAVLVENENSHVVFQTANLHHQFKSASLIKLGIASFIKQSANLNKQIKLRPAELVPGGVLYHLEQRTWSVHDLLDLMLSVSDNTAANALINLQGRAATNVWLNQHYSDIYLGRYLMEQTDRENYLSAATAMQIFQEILSDQTDFGKTCQTALFNQTTRSKLIANLPEGRSYNKTGELADAEHDIARIFKGKHFFDCCVMSQFENWEQRRQIILGMNEIGRLLYQNL